MRLGSLGPGVRYLVTDRDGGVSAGPYASLNLGLSVGDDPAAVHANRRLTAGAVGLGGHDIAWMRQVHGSAVRYAGPGWPAEPADPCDATFTDVPGLALAVQAADCVPVLITDPRARLAGAAHAGRAGTAAGVVGSLVTAMTAAGGCPDRMRALVGPGICGRCYEVPEQVQADVAAAVPQAACVTSAGTPGLDLPAAVAAQLGAAGVGSVATDGRCTRESAELYSYRRDGVTGRFAALVWLQR